MVDKYFVGRREKFLAITTKMTHEKTDTLENY
jgi:hypothetical protein